MIDSLLLLAQDPPNLPEQPSLLFNVRNAILLAVLIAILIGYKIYKNKMMN